MRNKMDSAQFQQFQKDFYTCQNTMIINIFEESFELLKIKYIAAASYIKCQLEPLKTKWTVCYINNQFTAGANSTQRVKSLNRVIHDCVKSNSPLMTLF